MRPDPYHQAPIVKDYRRSGIEWDTPRPISRAGWIIFGLTVLFIAALPTCACAVLGYLVSIITR